MEEKDNKNHINAPIKNMVEKTKQDSTIGPMIGSIIIILLIVVGGLYFLGSLISTKKAEIQVKKVQEEQSDTNLIEQTAKQSTSDKVPAIEADLKATNIDSVDKGLTDIDKEF